MSLTVYKDDVGKWIQVWDITEEWLKNISQNWEPPTNREEWLALLNQVKANCFCWQIFKNELILIAGFENGCVGVFKKIGDGFKLVMKIPTLDFKPRDCHSIQILNEIFLVLSYDNGQVFGISFNPDEKTISKRINLYENQDLLDADPIYVLKFSNQVFVIYLKINELFVMLLENGDVKSVNSKIFENVVNSVSIGGGFIYASVSNSCVVRNLLYF